MTKTTTIAWTVSDALRWIHSHVISGSAIAVSARNRRPYPEVTGYLIPNLLARGEMELARRFATFLVAVQRPDGAFGGPNDDLPYAFDTGQALRGLLAMAEVPQCREAAKRAADWLCATSFADGRLALPNDIGAWDLGPRGCIPETVHLYVLPALVQASDVLDEVRYRDHAMRARDAYLLDRNALQFERPNMLSHFFGYVHEALIDLDAEDVAEQAVQAMLARQRDDGAVPAYHDVDWICLPGQLQASLVLHKLGHHDAARAALQYAESQLLSDGGFPGSVGLGADYFVDDEPSWAVKFWLDADELIGNDVSVILDRNLAPDEWHVSICAGQRSVDIATRVANEEPPDWLPVLLETTAPGQSCLELGSGTGELSAHLARNNRNVQLLDFSESSLSLSRELFTHLGIEGTFLQGDVTTRLPQNDHSVDVVWSSGLLEHFDQHVIEHIVTESARIAKQRVVALVPNAKSLPYRLGKHHQEHNGEWPWGHEKPFSTLREVFERAGLVDVREWTVSPRHALEFLTAPGQQEMKTELRGFYDSCSDEELREMDQGYLLVTVGNVKSAASTSSRSATHRLAVLPNDRLDAYTDAGYPDLTKYFNPTGMFDEVFCLSPHEPHTKMMYGMQVVPTTAEELPRRIRELGIDVVRAYCLPAGQFACHDKVEGVRYLVSVHDPNPERCPGPLPDADQFLAVSGRIETFLAEKGADAAKVRRLPNRVDLDVFRAIDDTVKKGEWQARFPGKYRVLHVGRRSREKNLETLIRALGHLGCDYVGIFVGRGEEAEYLKLADEVGANCHFVDSVPNAELAEWYSFTDIMCTPSLWEGFGIVFVEALACSALVVTSHQAPMSEFITHEQNGLLVERYRDAKALAAMLQRAATDTKLGSHIREHARAAAMPFSRQAVDELERGIYAGQCEVAGLHSPRPCKATDLPGDMRLHLRTPDLREAWDLIARTSPDAWMFHSDDWQNCQLQAYPIQDISFVVEWQNRPVAICPLQRHNDTPHILQSTLMGTGGPALAADLSQAQRGELLRILHRILRRFLETGVGKQLHMLLPQLSRTSRDHWSSSVNPLVAHGYRLESTQTSLIDLSASEEDLFRKMRTRHRYCIRKAQKLNVEVHRLTGRDGMDAYYDLHVETYTRTGVQPHPKSYFDAISDHIIANGHAETFGAWLDGELVAAANIASFGDSSLYWTGAYSALGLSSNVGKLLQWEVIKAQKTAGRQWHETGEVFPEAPQDSKLRGLTTYKTGFGGILRPWFKGSLHVEDLKS